MSAHATHLIFLAACHVQCYGRGLDRSGPGPRAMRVGIAATAWFVPMVLGWLVLQKYSSSFNWR